MSQGSLFFMTLLVSGSRTLPSFPFAAFQASSRFPPRNPFGLRYGSLGTLTFFTLNFLPFVQPSLSPDPVLEEDEKSIVMSGVGLGPRPSAIPWSLARPHDTDTRNFHMSIASSGSAYSISSER